MARAKGHDAVARDALGALLEGASEPLYAYLRRRGHGREDARDLVQGFIAGLLEKDVMARVEATPERGRFRGFLLSGIDRHVAHEREKARAARRGGGRAPVSLDTTALEAWEASVAADAAHGRTPEAVFLRRYAEGLLKLALASLRAEAEAKGRGPVFAEIVRFLDEDGDAATYAEVGRRLGTSEGAVKVAVHRLRGRYREVVRAVVLDTLDDPSELEAEVAALLDAFRTPAAEIPPGAVTGDEFSGG